MEQSVPKCSGCDVDLESGMVVLDSNASDEPLIAGFNCGYELGSCDESMVCEAKFTVSIASNYSDDVSLENVKLAVDKKTETGQKNTGGLEKISVKEKPKAMSGKKPPKPPRAPRGLSLDSADQKLIRELADIARLKRARIERMKAVMKMKEAKNSSSKSQEADFLMVFDPIFIFET
ncbi:hypothetical protein V2J09_005647 [Rumex salicifolius]